jgi:hypothetical protein
VVVNYTIYRTTTTAHHSTATMAPATRPMDSMDCSGFFAIPLMKTRRRGALNVAATDAKAKLGLAVG